MAQINNHEFYGLDLAFVEKHKELFNFFDSQNLDVEINDDFAELKTILTSKDKDDVYIKLLTKHKFLIIFR